LWHNFGVAHYQQGKHREAEIPLKRAFYIRYQQLGPRHPDTIETLNYYGRLIAKEKQIDLDNPTRKEETLEILKSHLLYSLLMSAPEELAHIPEAALALNIGRAYHRTAQYNEALQYYHQARAEVGGGSDKVGEALISVSMAHTYIRQGKPQTALHLLQQALSTFTTGEDQLNLGVTLNYVGLATEDPQEALRYYEQALSLIRATGNRLELPYLLNNMGEAYMKIARLDQALPIFKEALSIVDEMDHPVLQECKALILSNMAVTYNRGGDLQEALHLNQESLLIRRSIGDRVGEIVTLNNLALLLRDLGRIQDAVDILEQIVSMAQQAEGPDVQSAAFANLALLLYLYTNRKKEAKGYLQQAISILEKTELTQNAANMSLDDLRGILSGFQPKGEEDACRMRSLPSGSRG
jgi:tetratricopeptide (TPR) repeat protein